LYFVQCICWLYIRDKVCALCVFRAAETAHTWGRLGCRGERIARNINMELVKGFFRCHKFQRRAGLQTEGLAVGGIPCLTATRNGRQGFIQIMHIFEMPLITL
jgi:hypothetical protein